MKIIDNYKEKYFYDTIKFSSKIKNITNEITKKNNIIEKYIDTFKYLKTETDKKKLLNNNLHSPSKNHSKKSLNKLKLFNNKNIYKKYFNLSSINNNIFVKSPSFNIKNVNNNILNKSKSLNVKKMFSLKFPTMKKNLSFSNNQISKPKNNDNIIKLKNLDINLSHNNTIISDSYKTYNSSFSELNNNLLITHKNELISKKSLNLNDKIKLIKHHNSYQNVFVNNEFKLIKTPKKLKKTNILLKKRRNFKKNLIPHMKTELNETLDNCQDLKLQLKTKSNSFSNIFRKKITNVDETKNKLFGTELKQKLLLPLQKQQEKYFIYKYGYFISIDPNYKDILSKSKMISKINENSLYKFKEEIGKELDIKIKVNKDLNIQFYPNNKIFKKYKLNQNKNIQNKLLKIKELINK